MKIIYSISVALISVIALSGLVSAGCTQKPVEEVPTGLVIVRVGLPTPLNDQDAPWGQANIEPYLTWIDAFNVDGFKVNGKTCNFKLYMADDRDSPEGGTAAAKQLVEEDGCRFLTGHWSWSYDAISSVTNPAKVIFVTRNGGGINYNAKTQPYNVFGTPSKEVWIADILAAHEKFPPVQPGAVLPVIVHPSQYPSS